MFSCCGLFPDKEAIAQKERDQQLIDIGTRRLKEAAKYKKARARTWAGTADAPQTAYKVGEKAYAQNPHYKDGTRLRKTADRDGEFSGQNILNDAEVVVLEVTGDFAKVRATASAGSDQVAEGWLRQRNLRRQPGLAAVDDMRRAGLDHKNPSEIARV